MKKLVMLGLVSTAVLGTLGTKPAMAKELVGDTTGDIEFVENDGDIDYDKDVTDPGDGGKDQGDGTDIIPPEDGDATTGPLRFNYVPAIQFGQNRLATKTQNYYALFDTITKKTDGTTEEKPTFFEVVDLRGGTKGWKVSVKNDRIFTSEGKSIKATLSFTDMTIQSNSNIVDDVKFPTVPEQSVETVIGNDAGSSVVLAQADSAKEQGYGSWSVRMGDTSKRTTGQGKDGTAETGDVDGTKKDRNLGVKLSVDGGQVLEIGKNYSTDLVWTLESAL